MASTMAADISRPAWDAPAAREAPGTSAVGASAARTLTAEVIDPWRWPRAAGATPLEQAIEDIAPYEPASTGAGGAAGAALPVNTNADYWTRLVGIAWDR